MFDMRYVPVQVKKIANADKINYKGFAQNRTG